MVIIVITLMLLINAFLAGYEMALASVSKTKLVILAKEGKKGAASALFMKEHIEGSLAVIQIGITLVGALAAAAGGAGADEKLSPLLVKKFSMSLAVADTLSVLFVVIPLSFITIVFAELSPKTFAIKNKEFVVLLLSPIMRICYTLLFPVIIVMERIVSYITKKKVVSKEGDDYSQKTAMEDLRAATATASSSRLFGKLEERIVLSSAFFSARSIKEIYVPLAQVYVLYAGDSISQTFVKAHLDMHTRFPVCRVDGDKQSIIGYLNFKDIFLSTKTASGQEATAISVMRPIIKLDIKAPISTALQILMKEHQHIGLVTNGGHIDGIITLEDIFEEMVGEIEDEYDQPPSYIRKFGSSIIASASAKMVEVYKALGCQMPTIASADITVEAWLLLKLGRNPLYTDKFSADGLYMEARKFRRNKIVEVFFSVNTSQQGY